mmetsp:Transcript_107411/g.312342  ORF Transcript_107411/g.312342 Transcript_107411/m.312342 type:complete len:89 (-) Transcript_107411:66-332(-)
MSNARTPLPITNPKPNFLQGMNSYGLDAATFRTVSILSAMRLQGIVEGAFGDDAKFYFSRTHELAARDESGRSVNVEWPLGALVTETW